MLFRSGIEGLSPETISGLLDLSENYIDQNRSILAYDDMAHPYARFAGQLASGVAVPSTSTEGVGLTAARQILRSGGSRWAAEQAAKGALRNRLIAAGAAEGGLAGFGAGEGGPLDRAPDTAIGAVAGATLGGMTGEAVNALAPAARKLLGRDRGRRAVEGADYTVDAVDGQGVDQTVAATGSQSLAEDIPPPPPGFALESANESLPHVASISSPRMVDRIDVQKPRPLGADITDAQRDAAGQRINPGDVLPMASSDVSSQDEAARIGAGMRPEVRAPNEYDEIGRAHV